MNTFNNSGKVNSDGLPPHDSDAERGLLGCILLDPALCIPECIRALPSEDVFYDLRHRVIYQAALAVHADGKNVDPHTVALRLKVDGKLDKAGGIEYLTQLPEASPSAHNLSSYTEPVAFHYTQRASIAATIEASEQLESAKTQKDALLVLRTLHRTIEDLTPKGNAEPLDVRLAARAFDISKKPPELQPRYFIGEIPIATVGNIVAVSAEAKAGKTAFIGGMLAATMASPVGDADCLGVTSRNPDGKAVIYLDTEQSLLDHYNVTMRAVNRAKLQTPPPWLRSYCLTEFSIAERRQAIPQLMAKHAKEFGGIHSVFLDGAADFVLDVNDPAESNEFVAEVHSLAIKFECDIVGIIHLNPGSDFKTRGHLGSQLERKAETNLKLEKDEDGITTVFAVKNRHAPISKNNGPRFAWDDQAKMHLSTACAGDAKASNKREKRRALLLGEAQAVFADAKKTALSWSDFHIHLQKVGRHPKQTADNHFIEMVSDAIISKDVVGDYTLTQ